MRCKFPYNENFVIFAKKDEGGNGNLIINFAWPMRETHKDPHVATYVHSLNRETTLTGKHDREAHEFCTGTHGSCSDWSTSHHLAMLRAYSRTGGMDKDTRSRDWSDL